MKLRECKLHNYRVNSFEELIDLGKKNILNVYQYSKVVEACTPFIGVFLHEYSNTEEMANILNMYWQKWKNKQDKPIFIDFEFAHYEK